MEDCLKGQDSPRSCSYLWLKMASWMGSHSVEAAAEAATGTIEEPVGWTNEEASQRQAKHDFLTAGSVHTNRGISTEKGDTLT